MLNDDYLLTIAQVAVALAGFTGLLPSFRESERKLLSNERAGRRFIVEVSMAAAFYALLPFPLRAIFPQSVAAILQFSMAGGLVFLTGYEMIIARRILDGAEAVRTPVPVMIGMVIITVEVIVFQFWNGPASYEVALFWLLVIAGYQFVLFIIEA